MTKGEFARKFMADKINKGSLKSRAGCREIKIS